MDSQTRAVRELLRRGKYQRIDDYYPDEGLLSRKAYWVHMAFFDAGAQHRERAIIAGNRTGKSELGAVETVYHLTGRYPDWWKGRRFPAAITAWAAGDTTQTVRDIAQEKLLGPPGQWGTGLIPKHLILEIKRKSGSVPDAVESVMVKHVTGGISRVTFKSYDQKRKSFQGTHIDWIWLDEECPMDIYGECVMRTADTGGANGAGLVGLTFTPLEGLTRVVLQFLPGGKMPADGNQERFAIMAGWNDVPHLSAEEKAKLLAATEPHLRDARSKGIPQLGAGAIYPIAEESITVADFELPIFWPRAYALDVGWNNTAAVWGAWDRDADILYLTHEYKRAHAEPAVHAAAIRARGRWIPGVIDPAARGRNQKDGTKLIEEYVDAGLDLVPSENAVEAGLFTVYRAMTEGRLKVFSSLQLWFAEFRIYRRDEKGKVVKEFDHLMDCTKYLALSGVDAAQVDTTSYQEPTWRHKLRNLGQQTYSHMVQ